MHLPNERIVFCGDLFLNGMPPLPARGHVTGTIANYQAIEALDADIYVAGHGHPGTRADVRAQREQLETLFDRTRECFDRGLSYDGVLKAVIGDRPPLESERMTVLHSYCELAGRLPESADPASRDHMDLLRGVAAEARLAAVRSGVVGRGALHWRINMPVPGRARRPRLGCLGRILAFLVLGSVAVLLIYAVFAPWAFFLGGGFHPLAFWQGWGLVHPSAGADYVVFVSMWPTPGSRSGYPSVTGTADLCTSRGERFPLRLGGGFLDKHSWRLDSDQRAMSLYLYTRPWFGSFTTERRPRFDLHGAWHNPDLVMDDHGTLSTAFLPDGRAYLGPPRHQPAARGSSTVTLRAGPHSEFDAACRALAR